MPFVFTKLLDESHSAKTAAKAILPIRILKINPIKSRLLNEHFLDLSIVTIASDFNCKGLLEVTESVEETVVDDRDSH